MNTDAHDYGTPAEIAAERERLLDLAHQLGRQMNNATTQAEYEELRERRRRVRRAATWLQRGQVPLRFDDGRDEIQLTIRGPQ